MRPTDRRFLLHLGAILGAGALGLSACSAQLAKSPAALSGSSAESLPRGAPAEEALEVEADEKAAPVALAEAPAVIQATTGAAPQRPAPTAPPPPPLPQKAEPGPSVDRGSATLGADVSADFVRQKEAAKRKDMAAERRAAAAQPRPAEEPPSPGNTFAQVKPNPFTHTAEDRLSTFAVDVDTASYALARRYLEANALPPPAAVRVEEFVNYFKYTYPQPESGPFRVHLEGAPSPFGKGKTLLKVGLQGKTVSKSERKPAHLVFLVDVSGSMASPDKLPLAQEALKLMVKDLNENDTVALVTYANGSRDVLPPTPATDWQRIFQAIDSLSAGGGTAMGSGFATAYKHALKKVGGGAVSRVIVLTDGDANLGPNLTADSMLESVRSAVAEGVTLSTIGFGMGNYRDDLMERLANKGNGNCYYIDGMREARKVFQTQLAGTLEVIAKDVKVQVEFNPATVSAYRLVGYENRDIADRDFRNDKVDAGEIGAGHSVTALYEVELTGAPGELATVRVRAKAPNGSTASEQSFRFGREQVAASLEAASDDMRFATAVAGAADVLRASPASETWSLATALQLARKSTRGLPEREEFVQLLERARQLSVQRAGMAQGR